MKTFFSRLLDPFTRRTRERRLEAEIQAHLADRASVMRAMLSRVAWILAIGAALGAVLTAGTGPVVSSMVLGVSPAEPLLVAIVAAVLAAIAVVSCAGPIRKSLQVDPLIALRED